MPFFGTTAFAAPGLGILAAVMMLSLGLFWLERRAASARAAGEGYGVHADSLPAPDVVMREHAQSENFDIAELADGPHGDEVFPPPFWLAVLPVILVVCSFVFVQFIVPGWDTSYLAKPLFGETSIEAVRGVWAVICGPVLRHPAADRRQLEPVSDLRASLDKGADASVLPIFNTASLVGSARWSRPCRYSR